MASSAQVKSLINSHAEGDDERFYAVALQVAAKAARAGQSKYALELKELVDKAQSKTSLAPVIALPQKSSPGLELFEFNEPQVRLADLSLSERLSESLEQILLEQRQRDRLAKYDLEPSRKILFTGPPGTGKTTTAEALATELGMPFLTLKLDKLITRFMGETAAKLATAFDLIRDFRAVYLFDEVDALAGERTANNDVGEMRRVLNSFLQLLEDDDSPSVIIAATNHPQLLDVAIFRRFDALLQFEKPTSAQAIGLIKDLLASFETSTVDWDRLPDLLPDLSQADLTSAARSAAKDAILHSDGVVSTKSLRKALKDKRVYLDA